MNGWRDNMYVQVFGIRPPLLRLCIVDAMLFPGLFVLWYQASYSGALSVVHGQYINHPGLFISALMAFLTGRAALKMERAVRAPWAYSFDSARSLRWYMLIILMGLSVQLLCR